MRCIVTIIALCTSTPVLAFDSIVPQLCRDASVTTQSGQRHTQYERKCDASGECVELCNGRPMSELNPLTIEERRAERAQERRRVFESMGIEPELIDMYERALK